MRQLPSTLGIRHVESVMSSSDKSNVFPPMCSTDPLDWTGLTNMIERDEVLENYNGYYIQQHYDQQGQKTVFILFTKNSDEKELKKHNEDNDAKFHIALDDENIAEALPYIFAVLAAHQVPQFKMVLKTKYTEFVKSGQIGKIFTIYLSGVPHVQRIKIAMEIEEVLKNKLLLPYPEKRATDCVERKDHDIAGLRFVTEANDRKGIGAILVRKNSSDGGMKKTTSNVSDVASNVSSLRSVQSTLLPNTSLLTGGFGTFQKPHTSVDIAYDGRVVKTLAIPTADN